MMTSKDSWLKVKDHFLQIKDVQKQGESIKIKRKMFAMFNKGRFIIKLPKERVAKLLENEEGLPYDPGNGKIMKEWVIIPEDFTDKWIELTEEARKFALTLVK